MKQILLMILSFLASLSHPFMMSKARKTSKLFGINEWRDLNFGKDLSDICVLPFPFEDVLLQGETKQLRLYEDRFIKLFDVVMEKHEEVCAMGLLTDSDGIVQVAPLVEIIDYNRSAQDRFGIFVTVKVVGRVKIESLTQMDPFIIAKCEEVTDEISPSLDLPNMVADGIDTLLSQVSMLEFRLKQASDYNKKVSESEENKSSSSDSSKDFRENIYRIIDECEENEDENDDDSRFRKSIFEDAFQEAYNSDHQGFLVNKDNSAIHTRSAKDLTAVSWAVFCSDDVPVTDRIRALDSDNLFERLKLGAHTLRERKNVLNAQLALAGLAAPDSLEDDDDSSKSDTL